MTKAECCRESMSFRSGHVAPGRVAAPRLLVASLALVAISASGQNARAQDAGRSAAGLGSPLAAAQYAGPAPNGALQPSIATPEELGDLKMLHKNYREAVETYAQGPSNDPTLRNKMGIAYHQLGQLQKARTEYLEALRLRPVYMEAANNLGTVEYSRKNNRRAISWYHKALGMAGTDTEGMASVHMNLGMAWFARKNYEKANLSFQTALKLDPDVFEGRGAVGQILAERSVDERARFHFDMAKLYARQGRNELAIQYLRKSLEEGYKDRKAPWSDDSDFATLRQMPEFQQLIAVEPRVL
jgi:tetratricopeptide (TPR) repeat protein